MSSSTPAIHVDDTPVYGVDVDPETRCGHFDTVRDVVAIKFACCGDYYPCRNCHDELADHPIARWARGDFDTPAVLCGVCGAEHTIRTYLECDATCPHCETGFNPGCRAHWPTYFDVDPDDTDDPHPGNRPR